MKKNRFFLVVSVAVLLTAALLSAQNIFWIESSFDSPRLVRTAADGTEFYSIPLQAGSLPQSMVIDKTLSSLYWAELAFINARINSIPHDFSPPAILIDSLSAARGIAYDPLNRKIYWTSTNMVSGPKISRASKNGSMQEILLDFGPENSTTLRGIGLDVQNGKMYWANFNEGKIQRADMVVGAVPEDIVVGLNGPTGIAVEPDSGRIFWTETNGNQIKSADLNGDNITLLLSDLSYPNYISVDNRQNRMVWTELGTGSIKSAALDGSDLFDYGVNAKAPAGIVFDPFSYSIGELSIAPFDTTVMLGSNVQFEAYYQNKLGIIRKTTADWSVISHLVGPISEDGLLYSYFPEITKVMARVDKNVAKTRLKVVDTTRDSSGINTVDIVHNIMSGKSKNRKTIREGDVYVIGGFSHPFNIINGSKIYFPHGSLHEDITVEIKLPKLAKVKLDSIEFVNKIINGIQFDVLAGDSLIEPYYFDKPISISIPFKRGILKKYGIDINNMGLFYAADSVTFDTLGISHVIVDSSANRIYALVEHFSTLVIRENMVVTSKTAGKEGSSPERFTLGQNYPNPFNPTTMISYQLPVNSEVKLSIFNVLGQKVATLVSAKQPKGTYYVQWDASGFASGIYLYRLETKLGIVQTKKLILLK